MLTIIVNCSIVIIIKQIQTCDRNCDDRDLAFTFVLALILGTIVRSAESDPTEELRDRSSCGISFLRSEILIYNSIFRWL